MTNDCTVLISIEALSAFVFQPHSLNNFTSKSENKSNNRSEFSMLDYPRIHHFDEEWSHVLLKEPENKQNPSAHSENTDFVSLSESSNKTLKMILYLSVI
jgi:hypothetical protein